MQEINLSIIGCGNLGLSIVNGLITEKGTAPFKVTVTKRNTTPLKYLEPLGIKVTTDNKESVKASGLVVVAVKPYNIRHILKEIKEVLDPNQHILVSLATGITLSEIREAIEKPIPLFRAMPNIAADVNESMTCICHNNAMPDEIKLVESLFSKIGSTIQIEEGLMEAATVMGACGIAYVMRFIRAMVQGGIQIGFDATTAGTIVNQVVKGASELLIQRKEHPEYEIDKVTTPKGCTIVGLNEMEHHGFSPSLIRGIVSSFEKIEQ